MFLAAGLHYFVKYFWEKNGSFFQQKIFTTFSKYEIWKKTLASI
jgi:hypothetical protein